MLQLQSERLLLMALSYEQLYTLSIDRGRLEGELQLSPSRLEVNSPYDFIGGLNEAIGSFMLKNVQLSPEQYMWYTHWLIVEKDTRLTVGGIGLNGLPDENGEVMIGYFIDRRSEGKGYATEAVQLLVNWIKQHQMLKAVIADTLTDGLGSQRVLQKAGFTFRGKVEEGLRWECKVK
jgi:RimJ/RimL family protein N-acetyltransferase